MRCICTVKHSTCIAEVTENSLALQVTGQTWDMGTVTHIPGKRGTKDAQLVYNNTETSVFLSFTQEQSQQKWDHFQQGMKCRKLFYSQQEG